MSQSHSSLLDLSPNTPTSLLLPSFGDHQPPDPRTSGLSGHTNSGASDMNREPTQVVTEITVDLTVESRARHQTNIFCTSKCFALRLGPRRCMMALALLLSIQTSILNVHAVWCSSKCFMYRASIQPFVIALAFDSAEDSDTVACVTDQ